MKAAIAIAVPAGLAAAGARLSYAALRARPPGGEQRWARTNHRGDTLTLLEGPAYVAGAAAAVTLAPGLPVATRAAGLVALAGAGGFGAVDDLRESGTSKGLRGHLTELAHGRLTTGGLKVLGIGATGLLSAGLARTVPNSTDGSVEGSMAGRVAGSLLSGAVIASSANLVNLFDLRPGRALKVVLLAGVPLVASRSAVRPAGRAAPGLPAPTLRAPGLAAPVLAASAAGAAAALLPEDLAEQAMLGDTGANAAGALLGLAAVQRLGPAGQAALLAVLAGLTLISERVSFTAVIESTPGLREFDALGRAPR